MYAVEFTNKSNKQYEKLEKNVRLRYSVFFKKLEADPFIGKLADTIYHAHVNYHWVAVWEVNKRTKTVIVTYVGSREGAPY